MSKKTANLVRLIYRSILSLALIATGIMLMVSCVNIYNIGQRPFTPSNISEAFSKIAVFVWITCGAIVAGFILDLLLPAEPHKIKSVKDKKTTLLHLQRKLNVSAVDEATLILIKKEEKTRKIVRIVTIALGIAAAIPAIIYSFNFKNFGADYNASVISACLLLIPSAFVCMGICTAFAYFESASISRQITLTKSALAAQKTTLQKEIARKSTSHTKLIFGIRIAIALVAIIFIALGIINGGMADVLSKAVNICTECIGLG